MMARVGVPGGTEKRRPLCAICDLTNETTDICDKCRNEEGNEHWRAQPRWEVSDSERLAAASNRSRPDIEERAWQPSDLARRILAAWRNGKLDETERVAYIDSQGRHRGQFTRKRPLRSFRELARLLGCDHSYVIRLIRRKGAKR